MYEPEGGALDDDPHHSQDLLVQPPGLQLYVRNDDELINRIRIAADEQHRSCAVCHRRQTVPHNFNYHNLPGMQDDRQIVRRRFGDRQGMTPESLACDECFRFVMKTAGEHTPPPKWVDAWPAVVWTVVTREGYADVEKFMKFFADDLRESWMESQHLWTRDMQRHVMLQAEFRDSTAELRLASEDINSGHLGRLISVSNRHCYPQVRCPLGCFLYVDDILSDRVTKLPAQHYLACFLSSLKAFSADSTHFTGARIDWTQPYSDLEWVCRPTLIVDEHFGLCIVTCSSKVHTDARCEYFHMPKHPLMNDIVLQQPDHLAPAVVAARVIRQGSSNS